MAAERQPGLTGVILAGGRAERMGGSDKGLLPVLGRPLIAYAIDALLPQVDALLINANRNLESYRALGYPVISDSVGPYYGPLAGMLTALEAAATPWILTAPCDSPFLPTDYAVRMQAAAARQSAEISVAWDGRRLQPVFALLQTGLRASLRAYLAAGERKIDRWFARHRLTTADFSDQPTLFHNINTPAELAALEATLAGAGQGAPAPPTSS